MLPDDVSDASASGDATDSVLLPDDDDISQCRCRDCVHIADVAKSRLTWGAGSHTTVEHCAELFRELESMLLLAASMCTSECPCAAQRFNGSGGAAMVDWTSTMPMQQGGTTLPPEDLRHAGPVQENRRTTNMRSLTRFGFGPTRLWLQA